MFRLTMLTMALCFAAPALAAAPNPYLAQARVFFQAGEFQPALKRLAQAERWESSVEEQAEVALYSGLCKFNLRRTQEARDDFALAIKLYPGVKLPALTSPKIVQLFQSIPRPDDSAAVPTPVKPSPPPPPPPEVRPPPPDAPVVAPAPTLVPAPTPPPEVDLAVEAPRKVPVGPIVLGAGAVAAGGVGVVLGVLAQSSNTAAGGANFQSDAVASRRTAEGEALGANISYVTAGVLAVGAVIWALVQ